LMRRSRPALVSRRQLLASLSAGAIGLLSDRGSAAEFGATPAERAGILVLLIDPTASCSDDCPRFCRELVPALPRLEERFDIRVVHGCVHPHLIDNAGVRGATAWERFLQDTRRSCPCTTHPLR